VFAVLILSAKQSQHYEHMGKYIIFLAKIVQEIFNENLASKFIDLKKNFVAFSGTATPNISILSDYFAQTILEIHDQYKDAVDWYSKIPKKPLVSEYFRLIKLIIETIPVFEGCLIYCKRCQIPFITHPCNAKRKDIGCPFGCREAIHKINLKQRSDKYNKSEKGKRNKRLLNEKRCLKESQENPVTTFSMNSNSTDNNAPVKKSESVIYSYLISILSLLEGRRISMNEILALAKKVRQRSLDPNESRVYYWINSGFNSS